MTQDAARDPFADAEFRDRTAKLIAILSTDRDAEAEVARRKLRAHLATHGLSFTDLANRLAVPPRSGALQSARRIEDLEQALDRANRMASDAADQVRRIRQSARMATEDARMAERTTRVLGLIAGGMAVAAASLAMLVLIRRLEPQPPLAMRTGPEMQQVTAPPPALPPTPAPMASSAPAPSTGQAPAAMFSWQRPDAQTAQGPRPASPAPAMVEVVPPGTPLLAGAEPGASSRGLLPPGSRMTVMTRFVRDGQDWLLVEGEAGTGFVPAGAVRPVR